MPETDPVLSVQNVRKSFGSERVLDNCSVNLYPGDTVLMLGSNGAGKSTLLRLCAGLLRPDRGTIIRTPNLTVGHVGHELFLYGNLTVEENLALFAQARGVADGVTDLLKAWQLEEVRNKPVSALSRGWRARTSCCRAFVGDPELLLLDEPSSALDDRSLDLLQEQLALWQASEEARRTLVVATHDLYRLTRIASRAVLVRDGKIELDSISEVNSVEKVLEDYRRVNR